MNLKEIREEGSLYLSLISGFLVAFGLPIIDSLLIGLIVSLLSLSGITLFAISSEYGDFWTRGALGFLGMTFMTACAHQLFLESIGALTWIFFPSLAFLLGSKNKMFSKHRETFSLKQQTKIDEVFLLIACIFLVLAPIFVWTLFGAIIALLMSHILRKFETLRCSMPFSLCIVASFFLLVRFAVMTFVRSGWSDFRWGIDESLALSKSVFNFGIFDNIYAAGHPLSYQWLNFSIIGIFDMMNHGDLFQTTSRSIWVIGGILVLLGGRAIVLHSCYQHQLKDVAVVFLAILSSLPLTPVSTTLLNISAGGIASAYLLAFLYCVLRFGKSDRVFHSLFIVALALGALAIRSVHLIFTAPVLFYCAVNDLRKIRTLPKCIHVLGLGAMIGYYLLFLPSSEGTGLEWAPFRFDFIADIGYERFHQFPRQLLGLTIIAILLFLPALSLRFLSGESIFLRFSLTGVLLIGSVLTVLTSRTSYGELHFVQVPLIALWPFMALFIASLVKIKNTRFGIQPLALSVAFLATSIGFSVMFGKYLVMGRADSAYFYLGHLLGLALVIAVILSMIPKLQRPLQVNRTIRCSVAALVVFQFAFIAVVGHYRTLMRPIDATSLRPTELSEIGNWSRSNLPQESILATNLFLGGPDDKQQPPDLCPTESNRLDSYVVDVAVRGGFYLPAAIIQRRFVALGPEYGFIAYPQYRRDAVLFSLEVACGIKLGIPPGTTPRPTHVLRYSADGKPNDRNRKYRLLFNTKHLYVYAINETG